MPTPENSESIARDEDGHILDSQGRPLELVAIHGVMSTRDAHEKKVEILENIALAAQRLDFNPAKALSDIHTATITEKAAMWDGYQHYNQNRTAYQQAAIEEDERKSK